MLDHESIRRLRACAQALAGEAREASAEAVVRRVFAIQAQDATAADLGIRVRGRDITARAIRTAYEKERSIVRNWYMRGTLHTIPSNDARWVLQLLSPRVLATTSRRYQQLGLDDDLRRRADHLIRRALAAHGPLTRAELTEQLTTLGIPPDGQAPFHLIRHAALTGILCHGSQRAGEATYVLLNDWLPTTGRFRWEGDAARSVQSMSQPSPGPKRHSTSPPTTLSRMGDGRLALRASRSFRCPFDAYLGHTPVRAVRS
jgi:hypothetical protein